MKSKYIRTLSVLLLGGVMAIGLVACGDNSATESNTASKTEKTESSEQGSGSETTSDLNENGNPKLSAGDTREYWVSYQDTMKVYCPTGFYEPEVWAGANMTGDEAKGHSKIFEWFYIGESGNTNDYINCPRVAYELGGGLFDMIEGTTGEVTYGDRVYKSKEQDNGIYIAPNADYSIENFCIIPKVGEIPDDVIAEILESLPMEE